MISAIAVATTLHPRVPRRHEPETLDPYPPLGLGGPRLEKPQTPLSGTQGEREGVWGTNRLRGWCATVTS